MECVVSPTIGLFESLGSSSVRDMPLAPGRKRTQSTRASQHWEEKRGAGAGRATGRSTQPGELCPPGLTESDVRLFARITMPSLEYILSDLALQRHGSLRFVVNNIQIKVPDPGRLSPDLGVPVPLTPAIHAMCALVVTPVFLSPDGHRSGTT